MRNRSYTQLLLLFGLLLLSCQAKAQSFSSTPALLEPSSTQYFQNQYLANPAMAGIDTGLHLNGAYRRQWSGVDGAPVTQFFSADGALGKRVGAGLHLFNDVAGLINRTRVALTYAYHLPLNEKNDQLSFGLSLAINTQHLNTAKLNGDPNDPSVSLFNIRDNYFEVEYGMAYTNGHLNVQAALPNVRGLFTGKERTVEGGTIFFSAVSYRFTADNTVSSIVPKVCFRGVRGYNNILDVGVNVGLLDNVANAMVMYHTSNSFTAGIGVNILKTVAIQALYTTQTAGISTYVNGTYEIGASIHLFQ
ncbi:PorP/SprF family type IX secretion system membrane protein [Chitinophaga eiseniae]|uniref:PorP/SprF family type IX secretion system membrane protein n=1 Tax=Chitinophaga eiseniae TaxID=634771 RepID=A0A847SK09_9BACT|nr:PorP/SprF family type IX secretion system membrane protein [Chitinophaga eiseniae]NLR79117.1 PorP/SprF family type IX secretion system membrane protein [Chitinophaga eiseniae]